ncbi:hypothetical protein BDK51DRAFT_31988 [Blyttiomyces helicus]|uniref:Uncharacterized protein n=1 Tax=Blyttiomyces helicus TaxID=388810 RepID=A0A4P9W431_9FUNG|nr:hypothetical protein BDK51DRAFT_31988 [Blyttiomyces helicus]|eukprot:RKO86023.1 hypothetical protein BDK51DRAFT_31988 [Blyttiomyces helicus]
MSYANALRVKVPSESTSLLSPIPPSPTSDKLFPKSFTVTHDETIIYIVLETYKAAQHLADKIRRQLNLVVVPAKLHRAAQMPMQPHNVSYYPVCPTSSIVITRNRIYNALEDGCSYTVSKGFPIRFHHNPDSPIWVMFVDSPSMADVETGVRNFHGLASDVHVGIVASTGRNEFGPTQVDVVERNLARIVENKLILTVMFDAVSNCQFWLQIRYWHMQVSSSEAHVSYLHDLLILTERNSSLLSVFALSLDTMERKQIQNVIDVIREVILPELRLQKLAMLAYRLADNPHHIFQEAQYTPPDSFYRMEVKDIFDNLQTGSLRELADLVVPNNEPA